MFYKFFIVGEHSKLKWRTISLAVGVHRTNNQQCRLVLVCGVTLADNADCQFLIESTKRNAFGLKHKELFHAER